MIPAGTMEALFQSFDEGIPAFFDFVFDRKNFLPLAALFGFNL